MKKVLFGAVLGAVAVSAIVSATDSKNVKHAKRMFVKKLEDVLY